jgi:hypothetical protein
LIFNFVTFFEMRGCQYKQKQKNYGNFTAASILA